MAKVTKAQVWLWREVLEEYNACCAACGSTLDIEYDHVIPRSAGGSDSADNIQILCHHCNNRKNGTLYFPKLPARMPEDSCTQIKKNREAFCIWLQNYRKSI